MRQAGEHRAYILSTFSVAGLKERKEASSSNSEGNKALTGTALSLSVESSGLELSSF